VAGMQARFGRTDKSVTKFSRPPSNEVKNAKAEDWAVALGQLLTSSVIF
jgi:hypothetical protein